MENIGYYNGIIKPLCELTLPVTDRAVYFGDGVYEVVYCVNKKPFALVDHINRFYNSLRLLKIKFDMEKEELKKLIEKMINLKDSYNQCVYWQASRGTATREHIFPSNSKANLLIMVTDNQIKNMTNVRYSLILEKDTRFFHCNIKTLNLIPSILASEKAKRMGCQEAVLHRGKYITECAHSNVAILKDGVFKTAPLSNLILPGVTRAHLINFCRKLDIKVIERYFTIDELMGADEIIVCASGCLCMGTDYIVNCEDGNKKKVGGKDPKRLKALQICYKDEVFNQCGGFL